MQSSTSPPQGRASRPACRFYRPLGFAYAVVRRVGCFEATRLLAGPAPSAQIRLNLNDHYRYSLPTADQLQRMLDARLCPVQIGSPRALASNARHVIVASTNEQVVGFAWIAREQVNREENFSRNKSLGTAIRLPESTAFIFNAWVSPQHRGQSLLASMIIAGASDHFADIQRWVTTMDWTNVASTAAFKKLGLQELGMIARFGCGRRQWIHVPSGAREQQLLCSVD